MPTSNLTQPQKEALLKTTLTALDRKALRGVPHDWATLPQRVAKLSAYDPDLLRVAVRFCGSSGLLVGYSENEQQFRFEELSTLGVYLAYGAAGRVVDTGSMLVYKQLFRMFK